jgi:N6-adenosine-specific RNA methylase IME4
MPAILRYDAACRAIAEAKSVDEAKDLADKAEAVRIYARQAKNRQLEIDAAEIRLRAERRLGELLIEHKRTVGLATGTRGQLVGPGVIGGRDDRPPIERLNLATLGVSKDLSARCQQLAAVPADRFETDLGAWRERVGRENERVTLAVLVKQGDKAQRRAERERELGERQLALPDKRYGVILADPEWRFEPWSRTTGMDRAAENHYSTSFTEVIASRPVARIAADDAALFLWGTAPMLVAALNVLAAWGFTYATHAIWVKDRIITGYWFRGQHELLLLGTRGGIPAPAMGKQWPSVIEAPRGRHSQKPDRIYDLIESYFPSLPKIELNARGRRIGWDAWGFEAPAAPAPEEPPAFESHDSADASAPEQAQRNGAPVAPAGDDDLEVPNFLRIGHPENNWRKEARR